MSIFSRLTKTNSTGQVSLQNNLSASSAPTVNDDVDAGYAVGSLWIDTTGDEAYRCVDATADNAVWVKTTLDASEFDTVLASTINSATGKTTPVDADEVGIVDSEASNVLKKLTWANIKATLVTYFDTLYAPVLGADDNYVTDAEKTVIGNTSGTNTGDQTFFTPRVISSASYTTDTGTSLNVDNCDLFVITAQAGALLFNAPSGTPVHGQKFMIRIEDDGTGRALTYNAIFRAIGVELPTTTVANKIIYMGFIYNSTDTKWDCVAVAEEA